MKPYTVEWKEEQQKKHGGWAQRHGDSWKWHYIEYGTEYRRGEYFTKKACVEQEEGK